MRHTAPYIAARPCSLIKFTGAVTKLYGNDENWFLFGLFNQVYGGQLQQLFNCFLTTRWQNMFQDEWYFGSQIVRAKIINHLELEPCIALNVAIKLITCYVFQAVHDNKSQCNSEQTPALGQDIKSIPSVSDHSDPVPYHPRQSIPFPTIPKFFHTIPSNFYSGLC
jgi:hypothetical protein